MDGSRSHNVKFRKNYVYAQDVQFFSMEGVTHAAACINNPAEQ